MKWFLGGVIGAVLIVIGLITVDLTRKSPTVPPGQCALVRNLVLPDRCASSCRSGIDCPTTQTRPYLVFWTQAAGCPDGVICG